MIAIALSNAHGGLPWQQPPETIPGDVGGRLELPLVDLVGGAWRWEEEVTVKLETLSGKDPWEQSHTCLGIRRVPNS